ncbi:unnamed protein product [Bursaphelenchus xylophilus]|uniref:(pine wood nematode) hypothetical protein n=1 Tax=Bursaphelenchus xylophilus TaxID=6326 RepID=A0A1I7SUS2_BURXY|nr:unnamed protein product [Bursaphelenchus xylophilus]CAG9125909.1 unnamed protein product [Bursaphelenchus xylophilus]
MQCIWVLFLFVLFVAAEDEGQCTAPTSCSEESKLAEDKKIENLYDSIDGEECEEIEVNCRPFQIPRYHGRSWNIKLGLPFFNEDEECADYAIRSALAHISCIFPMERTLKLPIYGTDKTACDQIEGFVSQGSPEKNTVFLVVQNGEEKKCDLNHQLIKYNIAEKNVLLLKYGGNVNLKDAGVTTVDLTAFGTEAAKIAGIRRALEKIDEFHKPYGVIQFLQEHFSLSTIVVMYMTSVLIGMAATIRFLKECQGSGAEDKEFDEKDYESSKEEGSEEVEESTNDANSLSTVEDSDSSRIQELSDGEDVPDQKDEDIAFDNFCKDVAEKYRDHDPEDDSTDMELNEIEEYVSKLLEKKALEKQYEEDDLD